MKAAICSLIYFFILQVTVAQTSMNAISTGNGKIELVSPSALGTQTPEGIDYSNISGSPFWSADWNMALLFLSENSAVKKNKVKLNFFTGEVHYMDEAGQELAAQTGLVKKIIFFDNKDTSKIAAVFQTFTDINKKTVYNTEIEQPFCQVLNIGKVELLKLTLVTQRQAVNVPLGKTVYSFHSNESYYLVKDNIVSPLKNLNKENILTPLTSTPAVEEWLTANKNKLKNEKDVINFLAFYNGN
jgi:hypothetical protein